VAWGWEAHRWSRACAPATCALLVCLRPIVMAIAIVIVVVVIIAVILVIVAIATVLAMQAPTGASRASCACSAALMPSELRAVAGGQYLSLSPKRPSRNVRHDSAHLLGCGLVTGSRCVSRQCDRSHARTLTHP